MKKSKKISSLFTAIGGIAALAVVPFAASSCTWGHEKETKERTYTVVGANDVNVACHATSKKISLSLKSNVGELITKDVQWKVNKNEGEHSKVKLEGRKYEVSGETFGDDNYVLTAEYKGKTITQDLKVNVLHNYIIYGSNNVSIQANQTTDLLELTLKDEKGNIENDVEWSINTTSQEHSSVALKGNTYKVTGRSYGSETYLFTAKHNGQTVTAPLNVSVRDFYINIPELPTDPLNVVAGQLSGTPSGDWYAPTLIGETGKPISKGVTWSYTSKTGNGEIVFNPNDPSQFKVKGVGEGEDTLTLIGEYNGQQIKIEIKINVAKAYTISLPQSIAKGIKVEVDETKTSEALKLMISDEQEYTGTVSWFIDDEQPVSTSSASIVNNNKISVTGKAFGNNDHTIKAVFDNGQEVTTTFNVDVAHKYTVSGTKDVTLENSEQAEGAVSLIDEEGNEQTASWEFVNPDPDLVTITNGSGNPAYTVVANNADVTGPVTITAKATFTGSYRESYEKTFTVTVTNKLFVQPLAAPVNVDYDATSTLQQLKLVHGDGQGGVVEVEDPQNVTWSLKTNEEAKQTYTTIDLNANGTYTIKGNKATEGETVQVHNVVARYKNKEYTGIIKATVNHVYHVAGNDTNTVKVNEISQPKTLSLLDETDAVASTSNITWNIGSNDLVAVNKPTENSYTLQGKEYGNDELDCNVVYTISGTTDSVTKNFKIPFAVNHAYAIPTINDITILTGNQTSMAKLELHDENNKAVTDQIEWSITTPVGQHSTFSWIDQAAGTYQITGNTSTFKTGESADIYTVTAKYKGEEFNQTIKVNVHDYKFATIDNVSIKYNDTTSTKTLKLLGDNDEELTNVKFNFDSQTKNNSSITHETDAADYTVTGTQYGEDTYTVTATYNGYTKSTSFKVNVNHRYTIRGTTENMAVVKGGADVNQQLYLYDETNKEIQNNVTWAFDENDTREIENNYFKATIGGTTGTYRTLAISGKAKLTEPITIKVYAKTKEGELSEPYSVSVTVSELQLKVKYNGNDIDLTAGNEFYIAKNKTMASDDLINLGIYDGDTPQSGVTWTLIDHTGTFTELKNFDGTGTFNFAAGSSEGEEEYTFKCSKDGADFTVKIKVIVYDGGQVNVATKNENYSARTCEIWNGGSTTTTANVDAPCTLVVPEQIGFLKVTKVADEGFKNTYKFDASNENNTFSCIDFSKATNLVEIGSSAFESCNLKARYFRNANGELDNSLDFSNTKLERIDDNAFVNACQRNNHKHCSSGEQWVVDVHTFSYITFPKTIKYIGANALGKKDGDGYYNFFVGGHPDATEPWFRQIRFLKPDSLNDVNNLTLGSEWVSHYNDTSTNTQSLSKEIWVAADSNYLSAYKNKIGNVTSQDWKDSSLVKAHYSD